jgi:hypothetical protein
MADYRRRVAVVDTTNPDGEPRTLRLECGEGDNGVSIRDHFREWWPGFTVRAVRFEYDPPLAPPPPPDGGRET